MKIWPLLLINAINQTRVCIYSALMGNHTVKFAYLSLKDVKGPQKNCVMINPLIQHKILQLQIKKIKIHKGLTSQLWGQYSWLSFLWLLYTPRETALLQKMTNQNSEFSILIQSFRSTEHQNLSSDFSKNITLRENNFRIRTVNSCINLILYNLCTVNVISNDDLTLENICAVEFSKLQFSVVHFNVNYVKLFLLFRKPYIFQLLFLYLSMNMFNHIFTLLSVIIYFHLMKIFIYILYILQSVILYFKNMYNHNFTFYSVIISYFHLINVCICTFNYFTVILHKKIKLEKTALLLDMFSMFANKNEIIYVWDSMRVRKL